MDQLTAAIEDVDEIGIEILQTLADIGGEADSSELRDAMDGVDPDTFNYRRRKHLVPYGLVETEQPPAETAGPMPAQILTLTDFGREFLEEVDEPESNSIEARMEQLEARIDSLEQENQQLREQNQELQSIFEQSGAGGVADEIRGLRNDISNLQDRVGKVEQDPVIEAVDAPSLIDAALIAGNTALIELKEEIGEERVQDTWEGLKEEFSEEGTLLVD